ncbi:hypothetical protein ACH5RR_027969 [Cinchona calisaya]|uniref:Uncharacterized protein n=1 Tax=Cinchona calisaya TaxID=153742 RepID=A0ABD2YNL5_9GENT
MPYYPTSSLDRVSLPVRKYLASRPAHSEEKPNPILLVQSLVRSIRITTRPPLPQLPLNKPLFDEKVAEIAEIYYGLEPTDRSEVSRDPASKALITDTTLMTIQGSRAKGQSVMEESRES